MSHRLRALAAALFLVAGAAAQLPVRAATEVSGAVSSAPVPDAQLQGPALLAALQRGGLVLYFRHTATDFSRGDGAMRGYDDCDNQRLLSAQGRADATAVGERIRTLRLPVGEAYASPYCRTMDHARRMLGTVTPRTEIREAQAGDYPGLKQLLAAPVPRGNRWIVGHGIPFRAIAGPPHLMEGEAAVMRPGGDRWTVLARIAVGDWATLGSAAPTPPAATR